MRFYNRIPAEMGKRRHAAIKKDVTLELMILFTILLIILVMLK